MTASGRAAVLVLALAATIAGCSDADSTTTAADASRELTKGIPAEIDQNPDGFVSREVVHPLLNAWRTASTTKFTQVDAGALTRDSSIGALVIFRYDFTSVVQEINIVKVLGSGAVRITSAPTGEGVEESAQQDGEIDFVGKRGVGGTLDLSDDNVTLRP